MSETDIETEVSETETEQTAKVSRWRRWRDRRAARRETERAEQAAREAEETAARRAAIALAAQQAAQRAKATTVPVSETSEAPLPGWMRWAGVWLDRTIGSLPLVAPLAVSGYETFHIGTLALHFPTPLALALTLALEGGVWKLARLYEKTLVAGDSTISLRAGLAGYLAAIGGLIYWYARTTSTDIRPALVVSGMALAGLYIWSRQARWARRAELRAQGKVDAQALRFSLWAWLLTPVETAGAFRYSVRHRCATQVEALTGYRLWRAAGRPQQWPPFPETDDAETETEAALMVPAAWQTEPVSPVSAPSVSRRRPGRPVPAQRAVSETDPFVKYADYISAVQTAIPDWKTRDRAVTAAEVMEATGLAGKQTALNVRSLIEQLRKEDR